MADELTVPGYPDETYWHLTDHQGSVRDIVAYDPTSEEVILASHHKYNAFGVQSGDLMSTLTIGYTGKYYDPDTGLQYHQYDGSDGRWLVVAIGRWLTRDPIGFAAGDANLYRYVLNAATIFVDPWGWQNYYPDDPFAYPPWDDPSNDPIRDPFPWPDPPPIKRPPGISLPDDDFSGPFAVYGGAIVGAPWIKWIRKYFRPDDPQPQPPKPEPPKPETPSNWPQDYDPCNVMHWQEYLDRIKRGELLPPGSGVIP